MDIRQLGYFVEVAEQLSFTKASETLHITQPTLSKMVKLMEEELGVTLLDRSTKQMELTDAGQVVLSQAKRVLEAFHNLSTELNDVMEIRKGLLRIGLPPMIGSHFFPEVMGQFRVTYPGIAIKIIEVGAKKVENAVENGELDIGVILLPAREEEFEYFEIVREELMVLLPADHPLATMPFIRLAELKEESFILLSEDFALHYRIPDECIRAGYRPNVLYESSQWDFISEMVAAKLGISLLPRTICQGLDPKRIAVVPLVEPAIPWNLGLIWRKNKYLSFAAREWIRFTRELLPKRG
ncbi:Cyn operon transcriptional activator [Chlamydia abortus]|uniref:LysR family transcriptional regulator n=1 Tax=Paenibacillus sp. SAFN-117 TaxID=3436860 RepID=UPI000A27F8B5|nr:Cyn operon transcriptional activator [Chlamydia abortus]